MKILVVSDSHSIDTELAALFARKKDEVDYIVHCGDSELDDQDTIWSLVDTVVAGNMDFNGVYPREAVMPLAVRIFVAHGHWYCVNANRMQLARQAQLEGCQLAFYGHTHVLNVEKIEGVVCINPGSFNHSRGPVQERTYAIVTIASDQCDVAFYNAKDEHLSHLDTTVTF